MIDLALIQLPNAVLANPKMYQPLGILYLAAIAEQAGFSIEIVDLRNGGKQIPKASFYGFSCTTPEINKAKDIAKYLEGTTIVGGAHPSLVSEDCRGYFDYIVVGEAEETLPLILRGNFSKRVIYSPRIDNLDKIPYPAWEKIENPFSEALFPGERYGMGEKAATLIASRGCPFNCAFCGNIYRTPVVYRSVENIIGELKALKERGIYYFRFEDDNFTLHPDFERLCIEINKLDINYKCHTRADLMSSHKAKIMKQSGCQECGLGIEVADNRVLSINKKKIVVDDCKFAISVLKNAGLRVKTYFMAGLPGEDDETLKNNKEFFKQTKPDKWTLSTFTPYPGCEIYNKPEEFGIKIIDSDWSNWWNFNEDHFVHVLDGQTQEQMWQRYLDFYDFLKEENWKK